ncbi:IgGFc-binding protein-like [Haliotis rubra]|uniref:IgGFc-binding protein-like n=1 Tax=Haliotis rubra TaxID=36100 RepID=UPI001EE5962A|nr:IgGFc-binding protein-like [Haliotis rubra]
MAFLMNILKLVCILYSCNQLCEALKDTKGSAFSLAFFPEFTDAPTNDLRNILYFSSPLGGACTVNYNDGTRRQTSVNIVANDVVKLALSDATQLPAGTRIEPKAIYVNCTAAIALYGHNKYRSGVDTSDTFTVLPDDTLSTDYFVASVQKTANLGVVATQDNTDVSVALNATCQYVLNSVRYTDGDTVNVTLGYGDVFQIGLVSSVSSDKCDLGGTRIHSNHQVAVFSGALFLESPSINAYLSAQHLVSQVPPESAFTKTQIIPKVGDK